MCDKVKSVASGVLTAEYPVLVTFLEDIGQENTTEGQSALAAYKALEVAVTNFQVGSTITDVESGLTAFLAVFDVLPIPDDAKEMAGVFVAAVEGILGLLGGSSSPSPSATPDEIKAHQAAYISHASVEVQAKAPWLKVTRLDRAKVFVEGGEHVGAVKFKEAWDPAQARAAAVNAKYENLKIA